MKKADFHWPTFIITNFTALILTSISAFLIQPLATRYWQSPKLEILGALPIHLYEEQQNFSPDKKSTDKMFHHRLAIIFKVKNFSSTPAIIHTALIEGCVKMDPIGAAEESLPREEQIDLNGKQLDEIYDRHKDTIQRIRVSSIFQEQSLSAIPVPSQATEYVGMVFPTSSAPDYIVPGSASRSGDCSIIKTPNKWATIDQLLEKASPRDSLNL